MPTPSQQTILNKPPQQCFHKMITMKTTDEYTNQPITESYKIINKPVVSPFPNTTVGSQYSNSAIVQQILLQNGTGTNKYVVPLKFGNPTAGQLFYYLKFHMPVDGVIGPNQDKLYITFAAKNTKMQDGYYDYLTGVTDAFKNQMKLWILARANFLQAQQLSGTYQRDVRVTFYGSNTNKPAEAETVIFRFTTTFQGLTSATGVSGPNINLPSLSDIRMKKNITKIGTSPSGIPIYKFRYLDSVKNKGFYQGVIAQDLFDTEFENAIKILPNGYYGVDYSKLDVEFKRLTD